MTALDENSELVIGCGFSENLKAVGVRKGICKDIPDLFSDHEEAYTRLLLHAKHASQLFSCIIIQSPDTDVAVLCTSQSDNLDCEELKTGVHDKLRFILVHQVCQKLRSLVCATLPGFHALTGCEL